jgi:hypothetical protein
MGFRDEKIEKTLLLANTPNIEDFLYYLVSTSGQWEHSFVPITKELQIKTKFGCYLCKKTGKQKSIYSDKIKA